jgi:NAD(P)-dependent dehydrogenase (short-subunit alcohol dehydrogenase family)
MPTNSRLFDVSRRTAIVTGASSGLGVTLAEALAEAGANVVVAARRTERLEELADRITAGGGTAVPITCDVTDAEQVEALVATAWDRFGRVDIMVNNAGSIPDGGPVPERLPHELFEQSVRVNLLGVWYCCRAVGARMLLDGRGGSIVNMGSVAGLGGGLPTSIAYQAAKAAVIQLTRVLGWNWADRGVRVNALGPGWFPSEATDPFLAIPAVHRHVLTQKPIGRIGQPHELIGALLYLASDASSYVTGQTLVVDGGFSASIGGSQWSDEVFQVLEDIVPGGLGKRILPEPAPQSSA